ncbi:MAG: cell division protein FtsA [Deltaproteobacteria bacterium]|nr:cell division protein FtsA [Deltaproteobacteria bacterium]
MGKSKKSGSRQGNIVVGLDIGTTKICAIVGEMLGSHVEIIGIGTHPSTGLRKGVVINIESTVESIRRAVEEAELMAGCSITSVYAGIAGGHIKGFNSHGIIAVKEKEVTEEDIERVIDAAKAVAIPLDREVIHVIPQEYVIDNQDGIKEPLGMAGVRLEAKVHIVTGAISAAQNIVKCCNKAGVNVCDIVLEQIASSSAVLSPDERELGVALVDIGGGTTDIALFSGGCLVHTAVIPLGGNHLTNDIAVGLRTPTSEAERIKCAYGCSMVSMVSKDETIEVPSVGGRKPRLISRKILAEIIEPRVEEMLSLVHREIFKSGYKDLIASGVVVTGGTAILEGITEIAEAIFDLPVKKGIPSGVGGLLDVVNSPIYATGVGLVLYGGLQEPVHRFEESEANTYHRIKGRMRQWLSEVF